MSEVISTDQVFSLEQKHLIGILADMMIPESGDFPSAAEQGIVSVIIEKLSVEKTTVNKALRLLEELAQQDYQLGFSSLSAIQREALIGVMKDQAPAFIQLLQQNVLSNYYQNSAVLSALGVRAHAPYPGGYTVAETDWSILDPVRKRDPFYKKVQGTSD